MKAENVKIGGIIQKRNLAKISVLAIPDRPGVAGVVFSALGARGINCPFIVHTIDLDNLDSIVLAVSRQQLDEALEVLETVKTTVGARNVVYEEAVGMIAIFGPHFGDRPGISGVMFSALASAEINILAISTSISSLSRLIDSSRMDDAIEALKQAFAQP